MTERILLTIILLALGAGAYLLLRRVHVWRLNRQVAAADVGERPSLLYFGSDNCAACPTQARYLEQVGAQWNGRLAIRKIDADREPEQAQSFGVLTLPTTIVLDPAGRVRDVNYGLTNAHKLSAQIERVMT